MLRNACSRRESEFPRPTALYPATLACCGFVGAVHVCGVPDLDPLAPSRAAGAWKRRADHLAALKLAATVEPPTEGADQGRR